MVGGVTHLGGQIRLCKVMDSNWDMKTRKGCLGEKRRVFLKVGTVWANPVANI